MAKLVGGIAASHSPQLSIPADGWRAHGHAERPRLQTLELERTQLSPEQLETELLPALLVERYQACQRSLEEVGDALAAMKPDILLVIGDDQKELFLDDVLPALTIYWGDTLYDRPPGSEAYPETMEMAYQYYHGDEEEAYATGAALGHHIIEQLVESDFDVASSREQPAGRSLGHAFTFIYRRVLQSDFRPTLVPIFLNTYYPPNQPTPGRCIAMGKAIAAAIESWDSDLRVAVVASGGLTHPIVDEELDRRVLRGLETEDWDDLAKLPRKALQEGTSEILNWVAAGAAMSGFAGRTVDYVPAYRSDLGSGCGMGFFVWSPK